jgi:hypothetical protein
VFQSNRTIRTVWGRNSALLFLVEKYPVSNGHNYTKYNSLWGNNARQPECRVRQDAQVRCKSLPNSHLQFMKFLGDGLGQRRIAQLMRSSWPRVQMFARSDASRPSSLNAKHSGIMQMLRPTIRQSNGCGYRLSLRSLRPEKRANAGRGSGAGGSRRTSFPLWSKHRIVSVSGETPT